MMEINEFLLAVIRAQSDQKITDRLREALSLFDIRVLDHLIVGGGSVSAFSKLGLL